MIERFVDLCMQRRGLVAGLFALLAFFGCYAWSQLALEAYPDIADTTAQVVTAYPGHAAEEVEEQVTIPIERALNGLPGMQIMRSKSTFGLSLVTLVFVDGVEDYWARARIRERVGSLDLPPQANVDLDPLTSPIGEIYRFVVEGPGRSQRELRELQRWRVIPQLKQIFGVADITNFGGETTQFQVLLDPAKLVEYGLTMRQVVDAIGANNANAGGSMVVRGEQAMVVRGIGLVRSLEDVGNTVVSQKRGTPVFVRNLGELRLGALARNGILGKDDDPDGVSGVVLLLRGENPSQVLAAVHAKVKELNDGLLPAGVHIVPYLDRTELVETTLHTVLHTLLEGMSLVILVLLLFLGSLRGAVIVALTIPLALLSAFILMDLSHVPANLLSLGAIDFGIIVDGAVVVLESILQRREQAPKAPLHRAEALGAAVAVARPIFFSTAIIVTAYMPLLAFQRVEKRLFSPMAFTVGFALFGAILVALALIPGLAQAAYAKPQRIFHNPVLERLKRGYHHALVYLLPRPRLALGTAALAAVLGAILSLTVGKEFLPELDEGSIWMQVTMPPGLSLQKAAAMADELRAATAESPEVAHVVTQLGRNDDGTDPWTFSHVECAVTLHPYAQWQPGRTKHDLIRTLAARLAKIPGLNVGFSQPMIDGVNDKIAGAHSELVVKVFGDDFASTRHLAEKVVNVVASTRGAVDVAIDQEPPLPQLQVRIKREAAARAGINATDIADLIEIGIGGRAIGQVFLGERRYDLAVRFIDGARDSQAAIADLTLPAASGARVPLSEVADVGFKTGESTITREMNRRHLTVKVNLRGRPLTEFLTEAQRRLAQEVPLQGTHASIHWGGQFENQQRAQARLALILPLVLALIFLLLYGAFGTVRHAALILANVPLALLGGMAALHLRGMTLNVSSAVGFIALFGVAVQNGVLMVANLNRAAAHAVDRHAALIEAAQERFRPVLMTATVAALGLLPAALARGIGSDVQRPLATVIVGGLCTATLLTLFLLPVFYHLVEQWAAGRPGAAAAEPE